MDYSTVEHLTNQQLIDVMDFLKEPIIGLSLDYHITFLNSVAAQIFGQSASNLVNKDFQKLCKQYQISLNLSSESKNILNGETKEKQIPYKTLQGNQQDFDVYISRQLGKGKPIGFILCFKSLKKSAMGSKEPPRSLKNMAQKVTGHVIEEQKSSQDYAKIMVDYYENIIAAMPGHVYWTNKEGIYLGCNDNDAKFLGLNSRQDVVGKTIYDLEAKEIADAIKSNDEKVMEKGVTKMFEEPGIPLHGQPTVYLTQKVPLHDHSGNVVGLLGISFDITDRKKMENDLKKSKEAAEAANVVKSQFIANMQHDLRTPCAGRLGMMQLYADNVKHPEKRENFHLLSEAAKELLNIVDNIVDINRLESGCFPILEKKFDIHTLLERVIRVEEPMAMYKMLQLKSIVDSGVPSVLIGDEPRLHRILLHLVGNAVKFTEKGYVHIRVKMAQKKKKGKIILKFVVEDTGVGIPEREQERVFEKFVRLTASNRKLYKGAGLGLSIVKHLVYELEGEIDIKSNPQKGTKFIVLLPLKTSILGDQAAIDEEDARL